MAALESDAISFSHDTVQLRNGRSIFRIQDVEGALILRALSKRLVNQHKIKIPSRDQIVRGVIEGLLDATPYNILRCDISSFYENVDVRSLVDDIASSTRTHPSIKQVFRKLEGVGLLDLGSLGIPRGLGLSAVLAELELRKFDHEARQIQDVYRYFRFADDMLVFCTGPTSRLFTDLSQILPINLQFNDKTVPVEIVNFPHSDKDPCDAPASTID
ncbi:RNA-directed DNA polymerase [uncultured Tateyamaria sp.]|uniref:RNA-directed DNA polymerase n=1 Tax=uncultured Tateyamaria sp. TaxID=455651 RepID=UPI0026230D99|nr:RNA-directed DNA polymerase [uncultured Tateyamaria sp.]